MAARMRQGDVFAFAELATRYWHAIHRIARNLLPDRRAADEVAEATILSAWHDEPDALAREMPFRTALYRAVVRRSLERLPVPDGATRSLGIFLPRFDAQGRLPAVAPDWSCLGDAAFDGDHSVAAIRGVLHRLDAIDRAAFVLREVEQLSTDDTARVLGIAAEHVRRRVHRASLILTGFLAQLFESSARGPRS